MSSDSGSSRPSYGNVLGCVMFDDNLRLVSDFLYAHAFTPEIEIEGKLGLVFSKARDARIHIPGVRGLVCINSDELEAAFAAEVDAHMFRHMNEQLLQRRWKEDQHRTQGGTKGKPMWSYEHKIVVDKSVAHMLTDRQTRASHHAILPFSYSSIHFAVVMMTTFILNFFNPCFIRADSQELALLTNIHTDLTTNEYPKPPIGSIDRSRRRLRQ